jgi:DinB family protein
MMTAVDFVRVELPRLHTMIDASLELTSEQLHAIPGGTSKANHIAWNLWHVARTEDNVVRFVLQKRRPPVWTEGGYAEKLGLPPVAQGTGMSTAEAQALRITDLKLFGAYVRAVWASTAAFLATVDPAALDAAVTVKPLGDMPGVRALGQICVSHAFQHVGEIDLARTLLGLPTVSRA